VFRKLEQNVKGFREHAEKLAAFHGNGTKPGDVGAMIIGRFPDGTPLALPPSDGVVGPENDFRYSRSDPKGDLCPFFAHIRKTNPRGESGIRDEKSHRIARRGITYGKRTPANEATDRLPETGVGLLFQCCQADLKKQFEFVQCQWANSSNHPKPRAGKDPVIGQSPNGSFPHLRFPNGSADGGSKPFEFHSYVTMKGGEYFFAPSITFLRNLANRNHHPNSR
jgi:deferrochelatase/peroxidase EfeB